MKYNNIKEAIEVFEKEQGVMVERSDKKGYEWFVPDIDSEDDCQCYGYHFENDEKLLEMINEVC